MTDMPSQPGSPAPTSSQAMMMYDANKKSMGVAYLLAIFLGGLGIHRFYLGSTTLAVVQLVLTIAGFALTLAIVGWFMLAAVGIWVIVDLFLIPGLVNQHNNQLIKKLNA